MQLPVSSKYLRYDDYDYDALLDATGEEIAQFTIGTTDEDIAFIVDAINAYTE